MIDCVYEVTVPYKVENGRVHWRRMTKSGKITFAPSKGMGLYPIVDEACYEVEGSYWDFIGERLIIEVRESGVVCDYTSCEPGYFDELRLTFEGLGFTVQNRPSYDSIERVNMERVL